jgi:hypothetical protein
MFGIPGSVQGGGGGGRIFSNNTHDTHVCNCTLVEFKKILRFWFNTHEILELIIDSLVVYNY